MDNRSSNTQEQHHDTVFIYKMITPDEADAKLKQRIADLTVKLGKDYFTDGYRAWLIRESRVFGLLTVQSIVYDQINDKWLSAADAAEDSIYTRHNPDGTTSTFFISHARFALSNNHGWIINNSSPESARYMQVLAENGGLKVEITAENAGQYVNDLLFKLHCAGFASERRINPYDFEQTRVCGYSRYKPNDAETNNRSIFYLPSQLACTLICPTLLQQNGSAKKLMKDPVVEVSSGISYERNALIEKYKVENKPCRENVEYYPNIVLKNIIGYLASTESSSVTHLSHLEKIEQSELVDHISLAHLKTPVITPSGFSYDKDTLLQYINVKEPTLFNGVRDPKNPDIVITQSNIVDNKNLQSFLREWQEYYRFIQQSSLSTNTAFSYSPFAN